jgi:hypothetical protein
MTSRTDTRRSHHAVQSSLSAARQDMPHQRGEEPDRAPASADRFGRRWRLVAAGLSNIWRFGDLLLDASSGRLLMRGPNGVGKTTALEALWPYLLDLNSRLLAAGKARQTTWTSLMRDGANGARRRVGYVWLTFAAPGQGGDLSYGVRIQFSEGASQPVKMIPFKVPGRPVADVPLAGDGRTALSLDEFTTIIADAGGYVFAGDGGEEEYVADLAAQTLRTTASEARLLASRIRQVRNPNLLGELSLQQAREALRGALPGVADDVIAATAEALAETKATRDAFNRDRDNARIIADFAVVWAGHVGEVLRDGLTRAQTAQTELRRLGTDATRLEGEAARAATAHGEAKRKVEELDQARVQIEGQIKGLESKDAYRAAGALAALGKQLRAEFDTAETAWTVLAAAAREAYKASADLDRGLSELTEDITARQYLVGEADSDVSGLGPLIMWIRTPRAVLTVGDRSADPGPAITITSDQSLIVDAVAAWRTAADVHTGRAEAAALAVTDHKPVAAADKAAEDAEQTVAVLDENLDVGERRLRELTDTASAVAAALVNAVLNWTYANTPLTNPSLPATDDGAGPAADDDGWDVADVEDLHGTEPGQILDITDDFARVAANRAAARSGRLRAEAAAADQHAAELVGTARQLRAEAAELRNGKLLPLPRPSWAGDGDDEHALGSALDWQPSLSETVRSSLEAALAAAGLLGATLTSAGAATTAWQVNPHGPVLPENLTTVLSVDPAHPLAATATAVLERVVLTGSAAAHPGTTALVIGRDGTFRTGVATGAPALAPGMVTWPPAQHVGARQRHAAALTHAAELEQQAAEAEAQADDTAARSVLLRQEAAALLNAARTFPSRKTLHTAEAARAAKAADVGELNRKRGEAAKEAQRRRQDHQRLRTEWTERTRSRGLPAHLDELASTETVARDTARTLRTSAGELADRFAPRLGRLRAATLGDDRSGELKSALGKARAAAARAAETQGKMDVLDQNAGASIEKILEQHQQAENHLAKVLDQLGPANDEQEQLGQETVRLTEKARGAREKTEEARQLVSQRIRELTRLLDVPGVIDAVFGGTRPGDSTLLADVTASLAAIKPYTKRTLRERYDVARARLAGSWGLANGDPVGELDIYVLSYGEDSFTPPRAAEHANALANSAEQALAAAEEKALHDFVVGLLPAAIRTGWVRMHDWKMEVNHKMRAAAASSQLSVQVRITLASNLPEHTRTVYELACNVFEADRTVEQDAAVGKALQALINAADGETMAEKVAAAVNIRDWVDITYEIHRPDGSTVNWTSRTGLSGGERRLVVLAPMLAAIAAGYDRLGETVMRLAALDEVPAEVDEQGREGLARYIASLDLDLICTSYLWDGAPGAWDGIDAWDLEAAEDTTVVGFPMLVRGLVALPGDPPTIVRGST